MNSIIVYRNPMEQAFWETTFYGLPLPAWFAGIFLVVILLACLYYFCGWVRDQIRWKKNRIDGWRY